MEVFFPWHMLLVTSAFPAVHAQQDALLMQFLRETANLLSIPTFAQNVVLARIHVR
jgi:hypothetical protein